MTSYLWRVEFTLQDDTSIWSAKDFIASLEFLDAYEVAKKEYWRKYRFDLGVLIQQRYF